MTHTDNYLDKHRDGNSTKMNDTDLNKKVGQLIGLIRHEQKLTQRELAQQSGISFHTLVDVENGYHRVTLSTLAALSISLNVRLGEFFRRLDELMQLQTPLKPIVKRRVSKDLSNGDRAYALMQKLFEEGQLPKHWKKIETDFTNLFGYTPKDLNQVLADLAHPVHHNNYPNIGRVVFTRTARGTYTLA